MRYIQISVLRNETATMTSYVAPWELPVLESLHGRERLTVGEPKDFPARAWPSDAESEMQRMAKLYGKRGTGDDALSHAERAYGQGSRGISALAKTMAEAQAEAEGKPAQRKTAKRKASEELLGDSATG